MGCKFVVAKLNINIRQMPPESLQNSLAVSIGKDIRDCNLTQEGATWKNDDVTNRPRPFYGAFLG